MAEVHGEVGREEVGPTAVVSDKGIDGGGRDPAVEAQVADACHQAQDGAERRVAGARVADRLPPNAILLRSEGERGKGGRRQFGEGTHKHIKFAGSNPEAYILQTEKVVALVTRVACVLARAEEEVEADNEAVSGTKGQSRVRSVCKANSRMD